MKALFFIIHGILIIIAPVVSCTLLENRKPMEHNNKNKAHQTNLVNVAKINPRIQIDIRYATKNNFTNQIVYPQAGCYLKKFVAEKLDKIQQELESQGLGLKIFDAYRPQPYQQRLWNVCPNALYVADPKDGSTHSRGVAVDLTLVNNKTGREVEMPSGFDDFTTKAHRTYNTMTDQAKRNCKLLEDIMVKYDFKPYSAEWWHYTDKSWREHPLLAITFEELEK
jgi:zinc D-Ala-D-Ala dipeptidase